MCRNIRRLHNFQPPATGEEIHASAVQYVRKLSGFTRPSKANEEPFARAVEQIARAGAARCARHDGAAARSRDRSGQGRGPEPGAIRHEPARRRGMKKINTKEVEEYSWTSPKGKFGGIGRDLSEALGWDPQGAKARARHPFAVEILRLSPGQTSDSRVR